LLKRKILKFPGAYNPLTAKLITEIGFDGIYISGAVIANDLGIPDIGLTTLKEVSYRANQISRVSDIPAIVDADTGFGDCKRTIETFEQLGLSGCHIEDQIDEKRCGHLDNKEIIPLDKMVNKIKTAVNAKKDKNFLIIARTDANSVEGIKLKNKPVFSVQYHPESNPGPQDSHYLFNQFIDEIKKNAKKKRH